jgi:hypothetical protein
VPLSDSDKIVAATLAAAKATAAGATSAEDYIAEYQAFLYHFEMRSEIAVKHAARPLAPLTDPPRTGH